MEEEEKEGWCFVRSASSLERFQFSACVKRNRASAQAFNCTKKLSVILLWVFEFMGFDANFYLWKQQEAEWRFIQRLKGERLYKSCLQHYQRKFINGQARKLDIML